MATEPLPERAAPRRERLDPGVFRLPVERIREGYYSDVYFNRTVDVLRSDQRHPHVLMQVFQKQDAVIGGMDEAIAIIKLCSEDFSQLQVRALYDGDPVKPWETALTIEGDYSLFARLETVYLGVLSRRTKVATNVRRVVDAARGKQIIFFPARHDHHLVQTGDGYAAYVSGAIGVSTDAQASWWGGKGVGTVPHALIAAYNGDTSRAAEKYAEYIDPSVNLVVLVDFENDCVRTSLEVARRLGQRLWGVRLDTSETLVDVSVQKVMGDFDPRGVTPQLCQLVRGALDREGFTHVRIVASGGFNVEKIERFEREGVPVDAYGVGSAFFKGSYDFTADVVMVEGRPCAKVGRRYRPNPRLELVS
ncbi:MAG: nicotinate phosphoribosyltransferase [Chloroflexi bacterium]|nr:MAG: nicotinate phosphoribosyltransferase [Chloroflexota bacterium]